VTLPSIKPEWHTDPQYAEFLRPDGYSLASGGRLQVSGLTGGIRGCKYKRSDGTTARPTLILLDDPQTDASARSLTQCHTREKIVTGAVLNLSGPGVKVSCIAPMTVIMQGDLADRLLDRDRNPIWNGIRKKMVIAFPIREDLWAEYREIRVTDQRANAGVDRCNQFYLDHQTEMDEGCIVAWPERFNWDECSGIQGAMNLKIDRGDAVFAAEFQNCPVLDDLEGGEELSHREICSKTNRHDRGIVPNATEQITAFIDVQKEILYFCVCAFENNFTGAVIDYSEFPRQRRAYFTLADIRNKISDVYRGMEFEARLYKALEKLTHDLLTRDWFKDDGTAMRISKLLIDANWGSSTDTVYKFCRQSEFAALLVPSHGKFIGASNKPIREWARSKTSGEKTGLNWRLRSMSAKRGVRSVIFDSNFWKSLTANRLLTPNGAKTCLTLFGNNPDQHRMFADHLTAEYKVRVEARGSDRKVDEWKSRPDRRNNHWWDCLVGCHVAASMMGVKVEELVTKMNTKRVSFRDAQKQRQPQQQAPGPLAKRVSFSEMQRKQKGK
jgi:hypothetical protein